MNENQRKFASDKLGTLGNIAVGALIFDQFLSDEPFRFPLFLLGVIFWVTCYLTGYIVSDYRLDFSRPLPLVAQAHRGHRENCIFGLIF